MKFSSNPKSKCKKSKKFLGGQEDENNFFDFFKDEAFQKYTFAFYKGSTAFYRRETDFWFGMLFSCLLNGWKVVLLPAHAAYKLNRFFPCCQNIEPELTENSCRELATLLECISDKSVSDSAQPQAESHKIVERERFTPSSPLLFLALANETVHTAVYTCV